jgi:hypothetical protein
VGRACSKLERRYACRLLKGKPEGKRPLRSQRHRWVDNVNIDPGGIRWGGMDWIDLVQDRDQQRNLVNMVINPWFP